MALLTSPTVLRGAERPRVELAPPYAYTLGDEAAELMARAGKPLDPWQVESCRLMMAVNAAGRWACTDYAEWVARQNGKGGLLEARALAGLFLFDENLIAWSSHEYKTSMEAFRRVKGLIRRLGTPSGDNMVDVGGIPVKIVNTNGEESFERLDTGQRLKFIARSKGSGRGFTADVQLVDEAFAYTALHQEALAPTTLAVADEQTVYMSTPPLSGITAEPMYGLRARADAGGDDSLGYRDWGIGGWLEDNVDVPPGSPGAFDVDDRAHWAASCPAVGGRITEEKLVALRRKLGRIGFAREVLGVWPRPIRVAGGKVDPEIWANLADPGSRPGSRLAFALEVSPAGRCASISSSGRRDDGRLHVKITDHRPGTSWVVARLVELRDRHKPEAILLDPSGPAGALLAELREAGIEPELVSGREMAQACGALLNDITGDRLRHCAQDTLDAAVAQASSRDLGEAWVWERRDASVDICPLVAVTLAAHGFRVHGGAELVPLVAWA